MTVAASGGCSRPVAVSAPSAAPEAAEACARFSAALPDELPTVGSKREVTPQTALTAAYGDPPVAIRCGVGLPSALSPTSTLVTVQGVDWLPEELTAGWRMTSLGRVANVEIVVPADQGPAPSVAADLNPTIEATLPAVSASAGTSD